MLALCSTSDNSVFELPTLHGHDTGMFPLNDGFKGIPPVSVCVALEGKMYVFRGSNHMFPLNDGFNGIPLVSVCVTLEGKVYFFRGSHHKVSLLDLVGIGNSNHVHLC